MGHGEVREWEGLQTLLGGVEIGWEKDEIRWRLPPSLPRVGWPREFGNTMCL
jgi:hypothetical protein